MAKQAMAFSSAPYGALRAEECQKNSLKEQFSDKSKASKPLQAFVELKEITATRGLPKEAIQKAVKQQIPSIEVCYQKALEKKPSIQGKATFKLVIDSSGKVIKATLASSKLNDNNLEQCIIQKMKELTFIPPENTDKVTINISFNFKTS